MRNRFGWIGMGWKKEGTGVGGRDRRNAISVCFFGKILTFRTMLVFRLKQGWVKINPK